MLERGGARWKAVRTVPHRFDAAERGATSETAIVLDCRLLYSADVRGSRAGQKMRCQLTRVASQLHSGPSVLDLAGRKSESRRGGGRHVSLRRLPINHDACWRCAYGLRGTYATVRAGAFSWAPMTTSHQIGVRRQDPGRDPTAERLYSTMANDPRKRLPAPASVSKGLPFQLVMSPVILSQ